VKPDQKSSFAFKAHRDQTDSYPVNVITFTNHNILLTGSPDGTFVLWDKDKRKKLGTWPESLNNSKSFNEELVDADFCRFNGGMMYLVMATGYTW